jgi:hypothetical protein
MKVKLRTRRAHRLTAFDILEERVVLSTVGPRFHAEAISERAALAFTPGSTFALNGRFNASLPTQILFKDKAGNTFAENATAVSATSVSAIVPIFVQSGALVPASGQLQASVVQTGGRTSRATKLRVANLPSTGQPAGALVSQLLTQIATELNTASQNYQAIAASGFPGHNGSASDVVNELNTAQGEVASLQQVIASGQAGSVGLGSFMGVSINANATTLGQLDQVLAASSQAARSQSATLDTSPAILSALSSTLLANVNSDTKGYTRINANRVAGASNLTSVSMMALPLAELESFANYQAFVSAQLNSALVNLGNSSTPLANVSRASSQFEAGVSTIQLNAQLVQAFVPSLSGVVLTQTARSAEDAALKTPGLNAVVQNGLAQLNQFFGKATPLGSGLAAKTLTATGILPTQPSTSTTPVLGVSANTLFLTEVQGNTSANSASFTVQNRGGGTLNGAVVTWLQGLAVTSPLSNNTFSVAPGSNSLAPGVYSSQVYVAATGVTGSPQVINVVVNVIPSIPSTATPNTNFPPLLVGLTGGPNGEYQPNSSATYTTTTQQAFDPGVANLLHSSYSGTYQDLVTSGANTSTPSTAWETGNIQLQINSVADAGTGLTVGGTLSLSNFGGKSIQELFQGTYTPIFGLLTITSTIDPNTGSARDGINFHFSFQVAPAQTIVYTPQGAAPPLANVVVPSGTLLAPVFGGAGTQSPIAISDANGNNDYANSLLSSFTYTAAPNNTTQTVYAILTPNS